MHYQHYLIILCAIRKAVLFVKYFFQHNNMFDYRLHITQRKVDKVICIWTAHGQ